MVKLLQSETFRVWLAGLRDQGAADRIAVRLHRIADGNPGDFRSLRGGVFEARIGYGPGYRLYYMHEGETVIVLLCGGDKSSQRRDIGRARRMAAERRSRNA